MTTTLSIHIDRGGMPRSGRFNKAFDLLLDGTRIGALGWGERKTYTIAAGRHTVTLNYKPLPASYQLDIQAGEGGTVALDSRMDMHGGGFTLFNPADGTRAGIENLQPDTIRAIMKRQRLSREVLIDGACSTAGIIVFFILSILTDGRVPGGFVGGFLGAVLGGLVGLGINRSLTKRD
jgi:hypothetical protein